MIIFLPLPTNDTRAVFALADSVAVVQFISALATFNTTVSNGARLAVLTEPGARLVKVKSPSSPAGPLMGKGLPVALVVSDGEPMMATFLDCPGCGVATAEGLPSAMSVESAIRMSANHTGKSRQRFTSIP